MVDGCVGLIKTLFAMRLLGPELLGVMAVITGVNSAVLNFVDIRLFDLTTRLYFRKAPETGGDERRYRAGVIQAGTLIQLGLAALFFVAGLLVTRAVIHLFTAMPVRFEWILACAAAISLQYMGSHFDYLQRFSERFTLMGAWQIVSSITGACVFLAFLFAFGGLEGYFYGLFFSACVRVGITAAISVFIWVRHDMLPVFSRLRREAFNAFQEHLRFLFYGNVLGYVKLGHRSLDVLAVGYFCDNRTTGLYKFARTLTDGLYLLFDAANKVYQPRLMALLTANALSEYRRTAQKILMTTGLITGLLLALELPFMPLVNRYVLANKYAGAEGLVLLLTLPFFFVVGIHLWAWPVYLVHKDLIGRFTLATGIGVIAQHAGGICLFLLFGSAWAFGVGYVLYYVVGYMFVLLHMKSYLAAPLTPDGLKRVATV